MQAASKNPQRKASSWARVSMPAASGGFTKDWRLKFETFGPTFGCHNGFREAL
jgi:hypothetical protein